MQSTPTLDQPVPSSRPGPGTSMTRPAARLLMTITIAVLLTVATAVPVLPVGRIRVIDVVAVVTAPWWARPLAADKRGRRLALLAGIWATAQVVSDAVIGSGPQLSVGVAIPVLAIALTGFLMNLSERFRISSRTIVGAVAAGLLVWEVTSGAAAASENPWKYHLAVPAALMLLSWWPRRVPPRGAAWVCPIVLLFAISVRADFRSSAALLILAALYGLTAHTTRPRLRATVLVWSAGLVAVALLSYPSAARSGYLGERARGQQQLNETTGLTVFLDSRPESAVSGYLVTRHPFLGLSSDSEVPLQELLDALQFASDLGIRMDAGRAGYLLSGDEGTFVPHSMALDAAVRAGVLALAFWLAVIISGLRLVLERSFPPTPAGIGATLLVFTSSWNALASPVTNRTHIVLGLTLFVIVVYGRHNDGDPTTEPKRPPRIERLRRPPHP